MHPHGPALLNRRGWPDPAWNSAGTVLLLDGQGPAGANNFVDRSPRQQVVTAVGAAAYASRLNLEGGGGSLIAPSGGAVKVASSTDFDFGAGAFTIEMDFLLTSASSGWLVARRNTTSPFTPFGVLLAATNNIRMVYASGAGAYEVDVTGGAGTAANAGRWHRLVFGRDATNLWLFLDNAQMATAAISSTMRTLNEDVVFGAAAADGSAPALAGSFDNIRITKGTWRYPTLSAGVINSGLPDAHHSAFPAY